MNLPSVSRIRTGQARCRSYEWAIKGIAGTLALAVFGFVPAVGHAYIITQLTEDISTRFGQAQISDDGSVFWTGNDGVFVYKDGEQRLVSEGRSGVFDVNDHGQAVWSSFNDDMFFFDGQNTINLGSGNFPKINNLGQIAFLGLDSDGDTEFFLFDDGQISQLSDLGGRYGLYSFNDNAEIAAEVRQADGIRSDIFLFEAGVAQQLTTKPDNDLFPDMNDAGQIVWYEGLGPISEIQFYDNGVTIPLTDNYINDAAPRINELGQVVWGAQGEVMLFDGLETISLGPGDRPQLNDQGHVAWADGFSSVLSVYDGQDIFLLSDSAFLNTTHSSSAINHRGQIVWTDAISRQIYLATPVPEPSILALLGIGLLSMGAARRRKKA